MENNFWSKLKNKSNKSTYELSKETNIPEEKLNEVFKGERELPTNHVDKVYTALKEKKQPLTSIERVLMEKFFIDNDILVLRKKWGYYNMQQMANTIGVGVANLYKLRPQYIKDVSDSYLQKVYDFFQDELNKNVVKKHSNIVRRTYSQLKKEDLSEEVLNWYNNFDLKAWRKNQKLTAKKLCKKLGFTETYDTIYGEFENHKEITRTSNWLIVQKLYDYINKDKKVELKQNKEESMAPDIRPLAGKISIDGVELGNTCTLTTTIDEEQPVTFKVEYPTIDKKPDYKALYEDTLKELERYKKLIDMIK